MTHSFGAKLFWPCVCCAVLMICNFAGRAQQSVSIALGVQQNLNDHWFGYNGQNVIRGSSWVDTNLIENIPLLKPKILRFPSAFAFWDWKRGWFVESPLLPEKFVGLEQQPNYLENFKVVLDECGAEALFTLNMVTATLQDQLAMLHHADSIGIPVKYVELGSEIYLEPNDEDGGDGVKIVDSIYPTAQSYGVVANVWIDSIHHHFPQAKVAVDGSYEKYGSGKRIIWNDSLKSVLNGREDAWTFHVYQSSAGRDTTETDEDKATPTMDEVPAWLYQVQKALGILQKSMDKMNPGKEAWITEYNLSEPNRPVQGMWAHGLFNGALTALYLRDSRVTHVTCHAMNGGALYGQYFTDSSGFVLSPEDDSYPTIADPPSTSPWALSASGHVMKLFGEAIDGKTSFCKLNFTPLPQTMVVENYGNDTFYLEGIQGVMMSNASGSAAYILNLTGDTYTLNTVSVFPAGTTYLMKHSGALSLVANDDSVEIAGGNLSTSFSLQPYSVLLIQTSLVPQPAPVVHISISDTASICSGDSVLLDAGWGYQSYLWSTGETTRTIWAKSNGDYWVNVTKASRAYAGADTVNVVVHDLPEIPAIDRNGPSEFCEGKTTELAIEGPVPSGVSYVWSTGDTTSAITIAESGDYWLTYINEYGCSSKSEVKTITVNPLPDAYITASGPTLFCDGGSVVLTAYPENQTYKWSNQQSTQSITVEKSGNFTVTVTDENGCKSTTPSLATTEVILPNPSISAYGPLTYCQGTDSTYLQTISGYSYQWKKGSTAVAGATAISFTPVTTGTYKVTITDANGCTRTTTTGKTVTINSNPAVSITASVLNICGSETSLLTASASSGVSYHWKKNGANIGGATASTYTATKAATYTCKVTKTSTGCSTTSNEITITSNCRTGGEEKTTAGSISVFPNPARENIFVSANFASGLDGTGTLQLRNIIGELVVFDDVPIVSGSYEGELRIDGKFPAGLYLLSVQFGDMRLSEGIELK